jgi:hypothetical protein
MDQERCAAVRGSEDPRRPSAIAFDVARAGQNLRYPSFEEGAGRKRESNPRCFDRANSFRALLPKRNSPRHLIQSQSDSGRYSIRESLPPLLPARLCRLLIRWADNDIIIEMYLITRFGVFVTEIEARRCRAFVRNNFARKNRIAKIERYARCIYIYQSCSIIRVTSRR